MFGDYSRVYKELSHTLSQLIPIMTPEKHTEVVVSCPTYRSRNWAWKQWVAIKQKSLAWTHSSSSPDSFASPPWVCQSLRSLPTKQVPLCSKVLYKEQAGSLAWPRLTVLLFLKHMSDMGLGKMKEEEGKRVIRLVFKGNWISETQPHVCKISCISLDEVTWRGKGESNPLGKVAFLGYCSVYTTWHLL